ncbi:MAG: patatin-like phospholipase family protein [Pseudomonadota bacterium]
MTEEILHLIKACKLFSSLDEATLKPLSKKFKKINVARNKMLFRQGDVSDGLYLLVSGKIVILVKSINKQEKLVGEVRAGETLGEIGAISHEPRSGSAKALTTCVLLKLSREVFCKLCSDHPDVLLQTIDLLGQRSRNLTELFAAKEPAKKHIVFLSANKKCGTELLVEKLREQIKNFTNVILLYDEPALYARFKTVHELEDFINENEENNEKILYVLGLKRSPLAKIALDKMDMLYVVANGANKPYLNPFTHKRIHNKELTYKAKPELVLLHHDKKLAPVQTREWLKIAKFALHHHVRVWDEADWERLTRFVRGRAIGLVLSGGGVRGWAHIGALKALNELGVPIDAIGGTSGGSIVAGYYAYHETYEDSRKQLLTLSEITGKAIRLWNVTWPAVSLFSSKTYTMELKKMFGAARIENLWLPYFCVTCNLSKSDQAMHKQGLLWKKIRGSTAVPGVYPPLVIHGQLHLDGGIVNNLPTDLMRKLSSSIGTIIAVELIHNVNEEKHYKFPPILTLSTVVMSKLRLAHKDYKYPHFVDMFLRSLLVGSTVKQTENAKSADVLISPDLSGYNLMKVTNKQADEMIKLGYDATVKAIKKWLHGEKSKRPKDKENK